jgi:hypothetical protein
MKENTRQFCEEMDSIKIDFVFLFKTTSLGWEFQEYIRLFQIFYPTPVCNLTICQLIEDLLYLTKYWSQSKLETNSLLHGRQSIQEGSVYVSSKQEKMVITRAATKHASEQSQRRAKRVPKQSGHLLLGK